MTVWGEDRNRREPTFQGWNGGKEVPPGMRWNGHRDGRETRKASVTAIKGKDSFRTVEIIDSEDSLEELDTGTWQVGVAP